MPRWALAGHVMILAACLGWAVPAVAEVELDAWGGYTSVNMVGANQTINRLKTAFGPNLHQLVLFSSGYAVGLEAGWRFPFGLEPGIRGEMVSPNQAYWILSNGDTDSLTPTLIPVMTGLSYRWRFMRGRLSLTPSVYGGYAWARVYNDTTAGAHRQFDGGGPAWEGQTEFGWEFTRFLGLELRGGYRQCDVGNVYAVADYASGGNLGPVGYGTPLRIANTPMDFDFSGWTASGGLNLRF
jgi:hypothetical protein